MTSSSYPINAAAASSSRQPDAGEVGSHLGGVHGRVEDVALLAPRAAHEHGVDALGVVAGHGRRPLGGLVVGVGVDGQQTQTGAHLRSRYPAARARPDRAGLRGRPAGVGAARPASVPVPGPATGSPSAGGTARSSPTPRPQQELGAATGRWPSPMLLRAMGVFQRFLNIFRAKTNKLLDRVEDPRDTLDLSYEKQLENIQKMRRSIAEVATAKKRVEIQANQLQQQAAKLQDQARQALGQNREDLAREALSRRATIAEELTDLESQHAQIAAQQDKLVETSERLQAQVAAFRTRKETLKATYTAAEAQTRIGEAVAGISGSMSDAGADHAARRGEDLRRCRRGPAPSTSSWPRARSPT